MKRLSWQQQLAEAITDPADLCSALALDPNIVDDAQRVAQQFPLRVTRAFLSRMEKGKLDDPLLRQVLPLGVELQTKAGYSFDPLKEAVASPAHGLLHKYHGRVLLTLTGACAIHCRYCFRRHYPYADKVPGLSQWQAALDYIASDATIEEVILSGGDPLVIKDEFLSQFFSQLESLANLKRLRIHTRLPIVIPDRITNALVARLRRSHLKIIVVIHANHANELDKAVADAVAKCRDFTLLNQSVLLKGVNNSVEALVQLSKRLSEIDILPYYLHLLDPVAGAAHFHVNEAEAKFLVQEMADRLPGYLVPKLVREVAQQRSKQSII